MASTSAASVSKAVNSLLLLSSEDQSSLVEVIEDYFTSPTSDTEQSDSESEDLDFNKDDSIDDHGGV